MSDIHHSVDFFVRETWGRLNSLAYTYSRIAQDSLSRLLTEKKNPIGDPPISSDPTEYLAQQDLISTSAIQTIVFSAMATEAAVYDLAAIHLGDEYARTYLDRLDLVAKWLVVPRLICGKSLRQNGSAITALRTLVRARNSLVHHKSQQVSLDAVQMEKAEQRSAQIIQDANTAFQAVILLSLELSFTLGTPAGVLPFFEAHLEQVSFGEPKYSNDLSSFISRCRDTHRRSISESNV
jgi:hypothetical protein